MQEKRLNRVISAGEFNGTQMVEPAVIMKPKN